MSRHLALLIAATVLLVACMLLPFLPGGYDGLAATLSAMAQLVGGAGVLLVPLGAGWLWHDRRRRANDAATRPGRDLGYVLGLASIGALTLVAAGFALLAVVDVGPSLGVGVIALWTYCAVRIAANLKAIQGADVRPFNAAPLYLVVLPLVAVATRIALVGPASEFSRTRAIENSATLIGDIERYHDANGHYPPTLLSVHKDYHPSVVGVERYQYAPHGRAYNLFFEHVSGRLGTREFVVYNPCDEQVMTSHALDLLELTPEQLETEWARGHSAGPDVPHPHWRSFWFD